MLGCLYLRLLHPGSMTRWHLPIAGWFQTHSYLIQWWGEEYFLCDSSMWLGSWWFACSKRLTRLDWPFLDFDRAEYSAFSDPGRVAQNRCILCLLRSISSDLEVSHFVPRLVGVWVHCKVSFFLSFLASLHSSPLNRQRQHEEGRSDEDIQLRLRSTYSPASYHGLVSAEVETKSLDHNQQRAYWLNYWTLNTALYTRQALT